VQGIVVRFRTRSRFRAEKLVEYGFERGVIRIARKRLETVPYRALDAGPGEAGIARRSRWIGLSMTPMACPAPMCTGLTV
jgi:hypothetical protein